ncbi:hypothetical protein [Natronorubrum sp. A-ect3]|uniref:hypothetical protein n=1 Tax=Natronorubrum sp. A-ect3 TaxID=3242698 RepID=UPI00359D7002
MRSGEDSQFSELDDHPASPIIVHPEYVDDYVYRQSSICRLIEDGLDEALRQAVTEELETDNEQMVTAAQSRESSPGRNQNVLEVGSIGGPVPPIKSGFVGLPAEIDSDLSADYHSDVAGHNPSTSSYSYADYIEIKTEVTRSVNPTSINTAHRLHSKGKRKITRDSHAPSRVVGRVPGSDRYTEEVPFPIYRATGTIISPDRADFLPDPVVRAARKKEVYLRDLDQIEVFSDTPPEIENRLWLHFVERRPHAVTKDKQELKSLYNRLNNAHSPSVDGLDDLRKVLSGNVIEAFVPISP